MSQKRQDTDPSDGGSKARVRQPLVIQFSDDESHDKQQNPQATQLHKDGNCDVFVRMESKVFADCVERDIGDDDSFHRVEDRGVDEGQIKPTMLQSLNANQDITKQIQDKIKTKIYSKIGEKIMNSFKEKMPRNFIDINHERYHHHCVLEPYAWTQYIWMNRMNGLEVITTILMGILAIWQSSFFSSFFYFMCGMLFVASKRFVPERMLKRQVIVMIFYVLLIVELIIKFLVFIQKQVPSAGKNLKLQSKEKIESEARFLTSLGFTSTIVVKKGYPNGFIEFDYFQSLIFEIGAFFIMSVFYFLTRRTQNNIIYLDQHSYEVHKLRLDEENEKIRQKQIEKKRKQKENEADDSELDAPEDARIDEKIIYTPKIKNSIQFKRNYKNEQLAETLSKLKEELKQFKKYRNYIECESFKQSHSTYLLLATFSNVLQALVFNSLIDISVLFLVLLLKSFHAYKNNYKEAYLKFQFLVIYWLQLITQLKIQFVIWMSIPQVSYWMENSDDNVFVKIAKIVFGLDFYIDQKRSGTEWVMVIVYFTSLFVSLYATQLWKQARWASIRDMWILEHNQHKCQMKKKKLLNKLEQNEDQNHDHAGHHDDESKDKDIDQWESSFTMFEFWVREQSEHKQIKNIQKSNEIQEVTQKKVNTNLANQTQDQQQALSKMTQEQKDELKDALKEKYQITIKMSGQMRYMPQFLLIAARFLLILQAYMYCQWLSFFNLIYVILTFLVSPELSLFIAIIFMIPLQGMAFMLNYLGNIKSIGKSVRQICIELNIFTFDLKMPVLEQLLFYLILTVLFMMISAIKPALANSGNDKKSDSYYIALYKRKLLSKHSSIAWKFTLFPLRYIQKLFFLSMFIRGTYYIQELNTVQNLGLVFFFAVYFTWDAIYRKTSKIPIIFFASFILSRYFYDLNYHVIELNKSSQEFAEWLGMYIAHQMPSWERGSSVYFRNTFPTPLWILTIIFKILNDINVLFDDKAEMAILETKCHEAIRQQFSSVFSLWNNFKNLIGNQLIYIYILVMIFYLSSCQINLITWIMYSQNIYLIATVCYQDKSPEVIKTQISVSNRMKIIAALVIALDTIFMALVGVHEDNHNSKFRKDYPWLYKNLSFYGLKVSDANHDLTYDQKLAKIQGKLYFQAEYLIMSTLINAYFNSIKQALSCEDNWNNEDFKKLYEYQTLEDNAKDKRMKKKKRLENAQNILHEEDNADEEEEKLKKENRNVSIETFKKKVNYNKYDLIDRFNFRRWQTQYIVYRLIDLWPIMDYIASTSSCLNGFLIMYIALYYNVSIFMFVYVASLTQYYIQAIYKIQKEAKGISERVNIGSQIDVQMASRISKKYNVTTNYKFHHIRTQIWTFQLFLLCFAAVLSFPTQIIQQMREKHLYDQKQNPFDNHEIFIKKLDKVQYWFYIIGIFTGNNKKEIETYSKSIGILFIGLFFEKAAINWLRNRWGCTYVKFQKFIELETRKRSVDEEWGKTPFPYKPNHYKYHNFYKPHGFDQIYGRIFEDQKFIQQQKEKIQRYHEYGIELNDKNLFHDKDNVEEFTDFIPYKVAKRIKETIQFSLRVDGQDKSLLKGGEVDQNDKISEFFNYVDQQDELQKLQENLKECQNEVKFLQIINSKNKLNLDQDYEIEQLLEEEKKLKEQLEDKQYVVNQLKEIDLVESYEEIEILKNYKIDQLEKIIKGGIVMKYKISFSKGMIFLIEALVMLTLLISIALKSNVFSLIYMIFIFRFPFCDQKHHLFARLCHYISISLSIQYLLYGLNITSLTAVLPLPDKLKGYPFEQLAKNKHFMDDQGYPIPIIFNIVNILNKQKCLQMIYFLGIGVDSAQLGNLMLDFFNLYLVSMYILFFRSPIFDKSMKKVFWKLPKPSDDPEQWARCEKKTQKQINWMMEPLPFQDKMYAQLRNDYKFSKEYINDQDHKFKLTLEYQNTYYDYDQILHDYVDLKYQEIWSTLFVKKIKNQLKDQIFYFRAVKQGSQVIYLGFHIMTIFVITLLSIMRQSLISLVYLIVIFIKIMYTVEDAMKERSQNLHDEILGLENEIRFNIDKCKQLEEENEQGLASFEKVEEIYKLKQTIEAQSQELKHDKFNYLQAQSIKQDGGGKNKKQVLKKKKVKKHSLPYSFKYTLQFLVLLDFSVQVVCQMPFIQYGPSFHKFGFNKIWYKGKDEEAFKYKDFMNPNGEYKGLSLLSEPLFLLILNCIMIVFVFSQVSIFDSPGYLKYVTQKDGSLNLLLQLSVIKGKSVAYRFNNFKILNILQIQKKKELVDNNFNDLKQRLKNWRILKKDTMNMGISGIIDQKQQMDIEDAKKAAELKKKMKSNLDNLNEASSNVRDIESESYYSNKEVNFSRVAQNTPTTAEKQLFLRRMSQCLVNDKIKHINFLVDIYQFIQKNWIEQIFFKNARKEVEQLIVQHSKGSVEIPSELERVMEEEAYEFISRHFQYSNKGSHYDLNSLITKFKRLEAESSENQDYKILDIIRAKLNEQTRLKLKDMTRTWEFTRPSKMTIHLIETFFYFFISKIQYMIYLCMIYSTYENAGLITIIYPFMIFGWALLEETRPTKRFWQVLKVWTTFVLFCKFFCNIKWISPKNIENNFDQDNQFVDYLIGVKFKPPHEVNFMDTKLMGYIKLGLYQHKSMTSITLYILPEVFILCLLMINSIYLRMLGLKNQSELEIEDITQAIHRTIERGDIEKVRIQQLQDTYMNLQQQYPSPNNLKRIIRKEVEIKKQEEELAIFQGIKSIEKVLTPQVQQDILKRDQRDVIKQISMSIKNATQYFKLDPNVDVNKKFEHFIDSTQLSKVLDDDILLYREGFKQVKNNDFCSIKEFEEDYINHIAEETMSGGDNDKDFVNKSEVIKLRNQPQMGWFESRPYFRRLFPALKIMKPGYDLYGSTNIFLTIVVIFVFSFYDEFNVTEQKVIPGKQGQSNGFGNEMILLVLIIIIIMLFERFANRTATKAPEVNQGLHVDEEADLHSTKNYFNTQSLTVPNDNLRGQKYNRWTRGLGKKEDPRKKIMLSDSTCLNYLSDLQEDNKVNRTKTSVQQKVKYAMHMLLLFVFHFYVFWYVPITGNLALYGTPNCDHTKEVYYGCKNFHQNPFLRVFYIVLCGYLFLSAMQIKFGLPIMKKPSSVLQYNDNIFAYIMAIVFQSLPFIVEIRCLIDFSFAKTSLDIFQFWELYQANYDMYNTKNGNIYYFQKDIGMPMPKLDRCLFGFTFSGVVLLILCGPLILFSPMAGFVAPNPVINAKMDINFLITRQISDNEMKKYVTGDFSAIQEYDSLNLESLQETPKKKLGNNYSCQQGFKSKDCTTDWFHIYSNTNAQLRTLNQTLMDQSKFKNWTESRFFLPDQIQLCLMSEYSDNRAILNYERIEELKKYMRLALTDKNPQYHLSLGISTNFDRKLPPGTASHSKRDQLKTLNTSLIHDCQTKEQLLKWLDFDCRGENKDKTFEILYHQAFSPYLILGDTEKAELLSRKPLIKEQKEGVTQSMHDMKLTFRCEHLEWEARSTVNSTLQTLARNKAMEANPDTCEPLHKEEYMKEMGSIEDKNIVFERVTFMLFSMLVSSSFLASYSLTSFYLGVVYILGSQVRLLIIWPSYKAFMYEAVETDSVLKLVDYIYNRRYEEDLAGEEEGYRMLREILHTPEFFKSICGSCLRGTLDPAKDYLSKEDEEKIIQIESLEKKGFEVKQLKEKILQNAEEKLQNKFDEQARQVDDQDDDYERQQ